MRSALLAVLILVASLTACGLVGTGDGERHFVDDTVDIRFHTEERPGRWQGMEDDHVPQVAVEVSGDTKTIRVTVPLQESPDPLHYIEAIILTDLKHGELQKVSFDRGTVPASAEFRISRDYREPVLIIAKCNLHDMWETRLDLE